MVKNGLSENPDRLSRRKDYILWLEKNVNHMENQRFLPLSEKPDRDFFEAKIELTFDFLYAIIKAHKKQMFLETRRRK